MNRACAIASLVVNKLDLARADRIACAMPPMAAPPATCAAQTVAKACITKTSAAAHTLRIRTANELRCRMGMPIAAEWENY